MNKTGILLTCLLSVSAFSATAGSVYKWTDENGVVHFGDQKPINKKSETVNVRSGTSKADTGEARMSPQEKVDALDKSRADQAEKDKQSREEEAQAKQREKNCEIATKNLQTINSHARIKISENGEQRYLTPEEIQKKKDEFQKIIDEDCKN
ncbi:DUF4124 domain-containing protein [Marinobacter halodurans]|uniref:DUF4124 domain-containing protein n=1 Tax=Marinobacter halodurans TaxID=2528979 RepID=A0ABY1ZIE2_9GAMM|nr:DUF4124 domain-containing protein [Marinobacter halodurans]TBW50982.1 DUF4124 domain-containing protein [Marinobacter halodurans]